MRKFVAFALLLAACSSGSKSQSPIAESPTPTGVSDMARPADMAHQTLQVLHFDGIGQHVDHGYMWQPQWPLVTGPGRTWGANDGMYYDMIAKSDDSWSFSEYALCDGAPENTAGGSHRLIFSGSSGNMAFWDGAQMQELTFESDDVPPPGWNHAAVMIVTDPYGNHWIQTEHNGVVVGQTPIPVGWTPMGGGSGSGVLLTGNCNDHSGFKGDIAQVRGWDLTLPSWAGWRQGFRPDRAFISYDYTGTNRATFLTSYVGDWQPTYPDLSGGYDGNGAFAKTTHSGAVANGVPGAPSGPPPSTVAAVNAPFAPDYTETAPDRGYAPTAVPTGAKIFDSFSRPDQELFHVTHPNVGTTEGGSLGKKAWSCHNANGWDQPDVVGLYNRSLVVYGPWPTACVVQGDSADADTQITRRTDYFTSAPGNIGLAVRMVDATHGYVAHYQHAIGSNGSLLDSSIYLWRLDAGSLAYLGGVGVPTGDPTSLFRVVTAGDSIKVYWGSTLEISATDATYKGKGFGEYWASSPPDGQQRGYNFTVF